MIVSSVLPGNKRAILLLDEVTRLHHLSNQMLCLGSGLQLALGCTNLLLKLGNLEVLTGIIREPLSLELVELLYLCLRTSTLAATF